MLFKFNFSCGLSVRVAVNRRQYHAQQTINQAKSCTAGQARASYVTVALDDDSTLFSACDARERAQ
jgi:hypothetical protein